MVYGYQITTPANQSELYPLRTNIRLTQGVISRWQIYFPPGQGGTLRLRIKAGADSILPINPEGFILGDNFTFQGDEFKYLKHNPFDIQVYTWNIDTRYERSVFIHIFIRPLWSFSPFSNEMLDLIEQFEAERAI